ncbi:hypothetical protein C8A05DRAFT_34645 [Staphylotrichum tortipilum]|uniref:Uncharacterized protein n=1 Tax=Staphylotrichum tortipilum TaxID=2831512 RepID=A0AAN6MJD2_9PEZI|nr:hypothetical protein C8A05DRAFT_34645 [Staphylotrichum longicolle]
MMTRRAASKATAEQTAKAPEVIEILSDSEPEAPDADAVGDADGDEEQEPTHDDVHVIDQPLLKAARIQYKTDEPEEEALPQDRATSPSSAKLAVRTKDTGSAKHRHVSIEIPLPTSSALRRRQAEGSEETPSKTPNGRKHITFDDSDHDEFVTPREAPSRDPLAPGSGGRGDEEVNGEDDEEEVEDSDDDAPPEAVSTRAAEADTLKAAEAAAKASEQQAAALRRKRQERDALLKRQAEERKRAQGPAKKDEEEEEEEEDTTPSTLKATPETEKRKREVPKLLPLELLESDDEDYAAQQSNSAAEGKNKRRKLGGVEQALLREPKLPKDKKLGSTAYRVVKGAGDVRLAPRVKKQAVNLKETLLRRDRLAQPRGGFFVKNR